MKRFIIVFLQTQTEEETKVEDPLERKKCSHHHQ